MINILARDQEIKDMKDNHENQQKVNNERFVAVKEEFDKYKNDNGAALECWKMIKEMPKYAYQCNLCNSKIILFGGMVGDDEKLECFHCETSDKIGKIFPCKCAADRFCMERILAELIEE